MKFDIRKANDLLYGLLCACIPSYWLGFVLSKFGIINDAGDVFEFPNTLYLVACALWALFCSNLSHKKFFSTTIDQISDLFISNKGK